MELLKIKNRLILIIVVAVAVAGIAGYIGISNLAKLNADTQLYTEVYLPSVEKIINADRDLYQAELDREHLAGYTPGSQEWKDTLASLEENMGQVVERAEGYAQQATTNKQKELMDAHVASMDAWSQQVDRYVGLLEENTPEARQTAESMEENLALLFASVREPLDGLTNESLAMAEDTKTEAAKDFAGATRTSMIILIGGTLVLVFLGYSMARSITRPIATSVEFSDRLARGDFSEIPSAISTDEMGELLNALGRGMANIKATLLEVSEASEQVAASSQELSASAEETTGATEQVASTVQQLSIGAQEQSADVQKVSETVNQMAENMQTVAEHIRAVNELAGNTNDASASGSQFVKEATKQIASIKDKTDETSGVIKELGQKSKEIAKIVDMITSIADQTNLLALNAAIEAARAGEQGRGFAVVADEVRKLAEESSRAAEEIASLINEVGIESEKAVSTMQENTDRVDVGTEVISKVDKTFSDIAGHIQGLTAKVQGVSGIVQDIAAGSQEITEAMAHVLEISEEAAAGMEETASYTQEQNASMEEVSSSADTLASLAANLQTSIAKFHLGGKQV